MLHRRRRPRRIKAIPFPTLIPNMITVLALCSGLTGIRFALREQWEFAVGAIVIAAVLDALDGRMARLLKGQSRFGAELDSLSDFVSFGVAPGLVLYLWSSHAVQGFGWMAALFFATCMALRLARFNTKLDDPDPPPFAGRFFTGTPAPAAAGVGLLPLILDFVLPGSVFSHPLLVSGWMVVVGLLMVSRLPTYSFKSVRVPQRHVLPTLIVAGLVIAALASVPWQTMAAVAILYLLTIPLSCRAYGRLRAEWESAGEESAGAGAPPGEAAKSPGPGPA